MSPRKAKREFIIEWDENDPGESIFNSFTEQDFIDLLIYYSKKELDKIENSSSTEEEHGETYYNSESEGKDLLSSDEIYEAAFKSATKTTKAVHSTPSKSTARGTSTTKTTTRRSKKSKEAEIKVMNSRKIEFFPWVGTFPYYMKDETENKSVGLPVKNMPPSTSDDTTVSTVFTTTLEEYDNDLFLTIPEDILKKLGWNEGDTLNWSVNNSVIKLEKAYV